MNSREEDLQLFVSWEKGNNHSTSVLPLLKGDGLRSSRRSWSEPREAPAPALVAPGCSIPARGAKGLWETPWSGINQTSQVSLLTRSQGRGTERAEARQQWEKVHLSREEGEASAGELGQGRETSSGALEWIRHR